MRLISQIACLSGLLRKIIQVSRNLKTTSFALMALLCLVFTSLIGGKAENGSKYLLMAITVVLLSFSFLSPLYATIDTSNVASGNWNVGSTWIDGTAPGPTDSAVILSGHTITLTANGTISNFTVITGGLLDNDGKNMTVSGNLVIDGTCGNTAVMGSLTLSGSNTTIDGSGNIDFKDGVIITVGNKTILSTANLTVRKKFKIGNGLTVTNYGTISILDNVEGGNAASTWINESNSTLNASKQLLNQGVLFASASGNTVSYNQAGNQNMKVPDANTYYHLQTQGNGIKKIFSNTIILGDLTISSTLDCNNLNINIAGNWINSGGFTEGSANVTFDGSGAQSVTNTLGETFYNLIFNKSAGTLTLNDNVTVTNILTMTSGNVDATAGTLILGDACGNVGTLSHTSGTVIGKFRRWINNTGTPVPPVLYPVGTVSNYRPALFTFNTIGNCGTLIGEFIATDPGSNGLPLGEAPISPPDSVRNTFVEGYWAMDTANNFTSSDYDIQLVGNGFTSFTINASTRLLTRANSGSPWTFNGTHVAANPDTAKRDVVTLLSAQYSFGDTTNCTGPTTSAITGPDSVCTDSAGATYSVTYSPPPVSTFTWTVTGGTITSGQGLNSITVTWGSTGIVGNVQVVENNGCTDGAPVSKTVNIHTLPTSSITGNTAVGEFAAGEAYSVTGRPGYTYTWTITGGTQASGGTTNSITVNWGAAGAGNVRCVASTSCGSAAAVDLPVTIYSTIVSIDDGDWDGTIASQGWATWDCDCVPPITGNARVSTGDTVTFVGDTEINNFTIDSGGTLDAVGFKFKTLTGNFIVDGTYTGTNFIDMKGTSAVTLGGMGSITITGNDIKLSGGNVNIASSANLSVSLRDFKFNKAGVTVTNYGTITIAGDIVEKDATSTWVNEANSTLNISGDLFTGVGVLAASATGNTINYNGSANQTVKCPNSGQYWHLTASGSGIKSLECNVDVDGNLTISGTCQLDVTATNYSITLAGNWVNTSSNGDPFVQRSGTVTIDGSGSQSISRTGGEGFHNLTVNKSGDTLTLNDNVTVSAEDPPGAGTLTMTSGNIKTGTNKLILGTSTGNEGSLTYTSGTVVGKFERWMNTTATGYLFPIGTSSSYRPALITFNPALTGGSVIGEFISADPDVNGLFLVETSDSIFQVCEDGYWDMTAANGLVSSTHNLELTGNGFTGCTITPETRILTRAIAANPWTLDGAHAAATGNTAKRTGIATLSAQYALGDTSHCAVPVTSAITGPDSVCTDSLGAAYSVTAGGVYNTYTWTITGGTQVSGGTTNSITVNWGSTGQVGIVQVVERSNCGFGATVTKNVNIHTLPTSSITGKDQGLSEFGPPEPYSVVGRPGYTYTWSILQGGGTIQSGQGTSAITIKWDSVGIDTVRVIAITPCDSAAPVDLPVTIYGTIVSVQTGYWDTASTWDCACVPLISDNVVIDSSHTVTLSASDTIDFIIIKAYGILNNSTFTFRVTDDYTIQGTHSGTGDIYLDSASTIDGTGSITNTGILHIRSGNKTITTTADITKTTGNVQIDAGLTVTNNGKMTFGGGMIGGDAATTWTNTANSTLNIGGDLLITGTLNASASGNTVNYTGSAAQTVKCPSSGQYYHFTSSGSGAKTLACNIDVDGDLNIKNTSQLDAALSNYSITLAGNWIDSSSNATPFVERAGTVIFDGSGAQSITNSGGETFYSLTVNKSADTLTINDNVTVSNTSGGTLTMTAGNIKTGTDTLILGTSTANVGTLTRTSGTVVGRFERWISSTGTGILFPVGTASNYRPGLITFTNLTNGSLTGEFVTTNPGTNGLPLNDGAFVVGNSFTEGYWGLAAANSLASNDYDLELTGNGFTSYTINARTRLLTRTSSGNPWTADGTHVAASGNTAKRDSIVTISAQYAFGDTTGCSGLPATSAISGLDSVCTGDAGVAYSVDDHPPNLYFWTIIGGTQASGGTTNSITVNWGSTGQVGTVSVIENDECGNRAAVNRSVNIHVLPTSAISGNNVVTENTQDEPYTVTNRSGYTYTWSTLQGIGTIDFGQGSDSVTIDWGASGSDTIRVVASMGCGTDTVLLPVTIQGIIISINTGNWNDTGLPTWDCACVPLSTDNVIIDNGDTVTLVANTTINNVTVRDTGTLNNSTFSINITGNYTVNGIHSGSGDINLQASGTDIDGTGTISNTGVFRIQNNRTILPAADLTKNTDIRVVSGIIVTNNGKIAIGENLIGIAGSSTWTNGTSSNLKVAGTLLSTGVLNASAIGNIVEYNGSGNQTIKTASGGNQYWHLILSTGGSKTLAGDINIDGNDTIKSGATLASASNDITIAGHWINNGDFVSGTNTVTFDGTTTISGTTTDTFNIVVISGALTGHGGNMYIKGNWTNNGTYTHNSGVVIFPGVTTVSGAAVTVFNNITVSAAGNLTGHATSMDVAGNWNNNNLFTHNGGTVRFTGSTLISGTATNTFNNVTVLGFFTGPSGGNMNIFGNWVNNFSYTHNSGTVTFTGTDTISGSVATTFNHVLISGTLIGHSTNINTDGNWLNNGTFTHNSGTVTFSNSTLLGGTGTSNFNNITITGVLTGPSGGTIGVAGNWNNSGTFTHNNGEVIFNGGGAQSITNTGGETFYELTVNKTAGDVTLVDSITIADTLTLTAGDIVLNNRNLRVNADAHITGGSASSYVQADSTGVVRKFFSAVDSLDYRVGDATNYSPFTLTFNSGTFAGGANVTVRVVDSIHPNEDKVDHITRYWVVTPTGITTPDFDLSYIYVDADIVGTEGNMYARKWSGGVWTDYNAVIVATNTLTANNVTSFSNFGGGGGAPLPVTLLFFDAQLIGKQVDITWTTANESNNDFFTVERSEDGVDYQSLTYVTGAGNSNQALYYSVVDKVPIYGLSYYRLKQTDYDGAFEYFKPVTVTYAPDVNDDFAIAVYPNPTQGKFWVDVKGNEGEEVLVVVLDLLGKEHYSKIIILEDSIHTIAMDPSNKLASGVYLIVASSSNKLYKKKLVIR